MNSKTGSINRESLLDGIEAFLDFVVITLCLWLLTLHYEGEFLPPYPLLGRVCLCGMDDMG